MGCVFIEQLVETGFRGGLPIKGIGSPGQIGDTGFLLPPQGQTPGFGRCETKAPGISATAQALSRNTVEGQIAGFDSLNRFGKLHGHFTKILHQTGSRIHRNDHGCFRIQTLVNEFGVQHEVAASQGGVETLDGNDVAARDQVLDARIQGKRFKCSRLMTAGGQAVELNGVRSIGRAHPSTIDPQGQTIIVVDIQGQCLYLVRGSHLKRTTNEEGGVGVLHAFDEGASLPISIPKRSGPLLPVGIRKVRFHPKGCLERRSLLTGPVGPGRSGRDECCRTSV